MMFTYITSSYLLIWPMICKNNCIFKKIPWSAFKLSKDDWQLVYDAKSILADSQWLLHLFSSERQPSLRRVLPALEELQTVWEKKAKDPCFKQFHQTLWDGLNKISKYYNQLDEKPAVILALGKCFQVLNKQLYTNSRTVLHPYYKLAYIKMAWGGLEEQAAEKASRNRNVKDWHDEALKVVERTMEEYWQKQQKALMPQERMLASHSNNGDDLSPKSAFDLLRQSLITHDGDEGWAAELHRYLKDMPADVTRDTDILEWWSVHGAACAHRFIGLSQYRRTKSSTQRWPASPWMSWLHRHHPCLVNASFWVENLLWLTSVLILVMNGLRNCRSWSLCGVLLWLTVLLGIQMRLKRLILLKTLWIYWWRSKRIWSGRKRTLFSGFDTILHL